MVFSEGLNSPLPKITQRENKLTSNCLLDHLALWSLPCGSTKTFSSVLNISFENYKLQFFCQCPNQQPFAWGALLDLKNIVFGLCLGILIIRKCWKKIKLTYLYFEFHFSPYLIPRFFRWRYQSAVFCFWRTFGINFLYICFFRWLLSVGKCQKLPLFLTYLEIKISPQPLAWCRLWRSQSVAVYI